MWCNYEVKTRSPIRYPQIDPVAHSSFSLICLEYMIHQTISNLGFCTPYLNEKSLFLSFGCLVRQLYLTNNKHWESRESHTRLYYMQICTSSQTFHLFFRSIFRTHFVNVTTNIYEWCDLENDDSSMIATIFCGSLESCKGDPFLQIRL